MAKKQQKSESSEGTVLLCDDHRPSLTGAPLLATSVKTHTFCITLMLSKIFTKKCFSLLAVGNQLNFMGLPSKPWKFVDACLGVHECHPSCENSTHLARTLPLF